MFTYVNNYGKKVLCSLLLNYSRKRIEMPVLLYTPQCTNDFQYYYYLQ